MADQGCVWLFGHRPNFEGASFNLRLSACDIIAPLQLQLPLVALYKCGAFSFFTFYTRTRNWFKSNTLA